MNALVFFVCGLLPTIRRERFYRALTVLSVATVFIFSIAVRANAEEEQLPEKFMLRLGGYNIRSSDTIMRLDSANAPVGAFIDFHDTLGGDTKATVFRLDGLYRFNDHHGLGFAWYDIKFTGSRVLDIDINWGDQTFAKSTQVDSQIKFDVYKLNYQYSVYHNDKVELGASFGFHIMKTSMSISSTAGNQSQSESITAPLPEWGLFANYNFTPRFSIYYTYQFFFISLEDKFRGGLQDFLLGVEYRVIRNVALGVAYNRFDANLELKKDTNTLNFATNWNGGMLYASLYF